MPDVASLFFYFIFAHFPNSFYLAPRIILNNATMKRMNKVYLFMLFLVGMLVMSSCSPRMMPVNTLRRLSNNIEQKGDMYSMKDWSKAKDKYVKANQKIMKHRSEYSVDELAEIAVLQGKCVTGFGKGMASSTARGVSALGTGVKSVVDEIKAIIDAFKKDKEKEE